MPVLGAGELNLVLLVKRKHNIGNKYFLVKSTKLTIPLDSRHQIPN